MITYMLGNNLYINLTNRCPNRCSFCIRDHANGLGYDLWLEKEPTAAEVIQSIENCKEPFNAVVFCGYGEPILRLPEIITIAKYLKEKDPERKIRINTNGQADLIWGRNIAPDLTGLIDAVSISLNAADAQTYQAICQSAYGEKAYDAMLNFAAECVQVIPEVILSVVDTISEEEIARCAEIAGTIGTDFRIRHYDG